jgi:hypothetical protein
LGLLEHGELIVLSPQQHADRVRDPLGKADVLEVPPSDTGIDDAVAYYQGASYMNRQHLDLWTSRMAASHQATPHP